MAMFSSLAGRLTLGALIVLSLGGLRLSARQSESPSVAVAGTSRSADTWTLERALARAMEANPDVVAAKLELERQEGMRLQIVARLLPQVSASASTNQRTLGLADLPPYQLEQPPAKREIAQALFAYEMQIQVRQTVFDGFSSWNQARRQRLISKQAFLTLQSVVARTVASVHQGFDAIQLRTAVVEAERRRLDEYSQLVEMTARKKAAGDIAEFELLRAQAEMEGSRADLAEAMRALAQAEQTFRRLLLIPDMAPLKVDGAFVPRRFDLPLEEAVAQARANRPDLQAAALAVKAARQNEKAEMGSLMPKFDVFASYGARSSYYDSRYQVRGWTYGAMGEWNIFEGGAARGRRITLRAERRGAEAKLAESEQGIVSKLHELYEGLHQATVAMEAQQKSVGMSERAWRDARRLYEVGGASLEQVLEASMTYRRAESRLGEAIFNYNSTVAEIEFSVGGGLKDSLLVPDTWKR